MRQANGLMLRTESLRLEGPGYSTDPHVTWDLDAAAPLGFTHIVPDALAKLVDLQNNVAW